MVFQRSVCDPLGVRALHVEASLQDRYTVGFPDPCLVHAEFPTSQVKELSSRPAGKPDPRSDVVTWRHQADTLFLYLKMTSSMCSALQ